MLEEIKAMKIPDAATPVTMTITAASMGHGPRPLGTTSPYPVVVAVVMTK